MQESNPVPVVQSTVNSEPSTVNIAPAPSTVHGSQNSFLVVLLSILLFLSVSIAGFFAFQTQKLVKELTMLKTEPTPEVTIEPVTTTGPTADWKTYTNSKFSFKYPGTVTLSTAGNLSVLTLGDLKVNIDPSAAHQWGEGMSKEEVDKLYVKSFQYPDKPELKMYPDSAVLFSVEFSSETEKLSHKNQIDLLEQILSTFKFTN